MKSLFFTATLFLCCLTGKSQQVVDVNTNNFSLANPNSVSFDNVSGLIYNPIKFVKVTAGTPFFKEEWMKARLFTDNGESYASHAVRLNLFDNEVNFLDAHGTEMIASTPVNKIRLTDTTTGTQYLFVQGDQISGTDKGLARVWLQVLVNDTVSLCRQIKKIIHQTPAYNTSTTEEEIVSIEYYFIRMNGNFVRVKTWSDLLQLFADKKDAVNQYIHDHHLKGKSGDDYTQLVQYYNSIKNVQKAGVGQ
jgi:hypothetical protein